MHGEKRRKQPVDQRQRWQISSGLGCLLLPHRAMRFAKIGLVGVVIRAAALHGCHLCTSDAFRACVCGHRKSSEQ